MRAHLSQNKNTYLAVLALCVVLLGAGLLTRGMPVPKKSTDTLMIMSDTIGYLPPHEHSINNTAVDSILAKGHGLDLIPALYTVPEDIWVTRIDLVINNAPASIVHHIILGDITKPNPVCPKTRHEEIVTMGSETPPYIVFPAPYGIFLKKGDRLALFGMVHNPLPPEGEGGTYRSVSIGFKLTGETTNPTRYKPVYFYRLFLDKTPHCEGPYTEDEDVFTVPANTVDFTKSSDSAPGQNPTSYTFPTNGLILIMGAHLHPWEGGKKVDAFLNGTLIRTFTPRQIPPHPWTWLTLGNTTPLPVKAGDTISYSTTYTNLNDLPLTDAMGMLGFFFSPDSTTTPKAQ